MFCFGISTPFFAGVRFDCSFSQPAVVDGDGVYETLFRCEGERGRGGGKERRGEERRGEERTYVVCYYNTLFAALQ